MLENMEENETSRERLTSIDILACSLDMKVAADDVGIQDREVQTMSFHDYTVVYHIGLCIGENRKLSSAMRHRWL